MAEDKDVELYEVLQDKYLNYAVSVITDRALPDVRDGMKPVQRRILYAMFHDLHLNGGAKHRKCAAIVGVVLGQYHPHGDTAAYEALVRLAQDFNLRYPLVDGSGNFGSIDGDNAAAMRYTEARLTPLADELLDEIKYKTVDYRPNYDGMYVEPVVLPARWPQLLCNGTSGIAVGMATNIPPHNIVEVLEACIHLIDNRDSQVKDLLKFIKGPDFPTGATIINTKKELEEIYSTGSGSITLRAEHKIEDLGRGKANIVITEIPYQVNRASLIEQIGELIQNNKVPQLLDITNESDAKTRVVLEIKSKADEQLVLNYLYKHTSLQTSIKVNITTLVPSETGEANKPIKADLKDLIEEYITHRFNVLTKKFQHELEQLERRIHLLKGFEAIFLDLDKALKIIRASSGKEDAAKNLMKAFPLDEEQTNAILETKLYNLAKLEMMKIKDELKQKRELADELKRKLGNDKLMWKEVKEGFKEIIQKYGDKRRSTISTRTEATIELDADAYIEHEDNMVVITKEGWIKRMKDVKSVSTLRVREGDQVIGLLRANTKDKMLLFTNLGMVYSLKVNDLQYTPGFGEPIQKLLNFSDGEKIISVCSIGENVSIAGKLLLDTGEDKNFLPILFVTSHGMGFRYLVGMDEETNRKGRRCVKLSEGDVVVAAYFITEKKVFMASFMGKGAEINVKEINTLTAAGKGIHLMKLGSEDYVIAVALMNEKTKVTLLNNNQNEVRVKAGDCAISSRNHAPKSIISRGRLVNMVGTPEWSGFVIPEELNN